MSGSARRLVHDERVESHLRDMNRRGSVLVALEKKKEGLERIQATFGDRPDLVIVFRGLHLGMTQQEIAAELAKRGLRGASQPRVSESVATLEDAGFVTRSAKGRPTTLDGWEEFGLSRVLKKLLKKTKVVDLV
jgi:hypothetical protein